MKKLLLIGTILVSCLFCINVRAEEIINNLTTKNIIKYDLFEWKVSAIHWWTSYGHGEFSEDEAPNAGTIIDYMVYEMDDYLYEYSECDKYTDPETGETWDTSCEFLVPANYFEEVIKKSFNVDDEYILNNIRDSYESTMGDFAYILKDGAYYYEYEALYGWGGVPDEEVAFMGYKDLGNNKYELFSYLVSYGDEIYNEEISDYEWIEFVPGKDDIYGEDYIIDYYTYEDEDGSTKEVYNVLKIVGYTKALIEYDGELVKYLSYERLDKEDAPNINELETKSTSKVITKTDNINVNAPEGTFIEGTKITVEKQEKGNIFDVASKALKEKFTSFVIYEINAKAGEYDVEPNGKVEISIKVPEGYKSPVIYYVSEDGKLEKLETKVKDGYAVAEVTHFSTYAIVDEKVTVAEKVEQVVDKVVENVVENPKTGIASGVGLVALAGGCGAYFYNKNKKKNKFPQS